MTCPRCGAAAAHWGYQLWICLACGWRREGEETDMLLLGPSTLRAIMPRCPDPHTWAPLLAAAMRRYDIVGPARASCFLAQIAHESGECNRLVEDLNYGIAGLVNTWPAHFSESVARQYARQPERIANRAYANRLGNGDEGSGDGWRYRGRGLVHLTGKTNYRLAGADLGLPLEEEPERVEQPATAALTAAAWWGRNKANQLADLAIDEETFDRVSRLVNGGGHGRMERRRYWRAAREALGQA